MAELPNGEPPREEAPAPAGAGPSTQHREEVMYPLRALAAEAVKLQQTGGDDEVVIVIQDPDGYAPRPAALSPEAFAAASLFDGRRTAKEVVRAFEDRFGATMDTQQVQLLADELDRGLFLASPRFQRRLRALILDYLRMPVRPASQAGKAYPAEPDKLLRMVEGFFAAPDGPGALPPPAPAQRHTLPGLVLPHIDLRVGGATYAHGYKALLEDSQADLVVVLGVAHQGPGEGLFSVSTKDFATPLGTVRVARGMCERLQKVSDVEAPVAEYAHRGEHSVEFQAVILQALLHERLGRDFELVPILCGPVEPFLAEERSPLEDGHFNRFVETLRTELDGARRRWSVLASVDFSHVGPKFGDFTPVTERLLPPVRRGDERLLSRIESLDAEGFCAEIVRTHNSRHVDAAVPVLTLLALGKGLFKRARRLHYDQMLEVPTKSVVSFASLAFEAEDNFQSETQAQPDGTLH